MTPLALLIRAQAGKTAQYEGDDWCELFPAEVETFGIESVRFPLMVVAFDAFEAFVGGTVGSDFDTRYRAEIEAARLDCPDLYRQGNNESAWYEFASLYAGLTHREAWQWYAKHRAWLGRNNILQFRDGS